ncbi:MAG: AEC family transporter [Sulfuriferula sp.]|nr:AEC family transporter [Sulfuriferula sp.]
MTLNHYWQLLLEVMLPMTLLVVSGGVWRRYLADEQVRAIRSHIASITINLFAPALLFAAAASAHITVELLSVPALLATGILIGSGLLYWLLFRTRLGVALSLPTKTGLLLCGVFGNVLFMGYPLLHFLFGDDGVRYAAFADMGAATPLLWSLGVWMAIRLSGSGVRISNPIKTWLLLPPVWSFLLGASLSMMPIDTTPLVHAARFIGQPTVPIMLLMLGLTIPWRKLAPHPAVITVALFKIMLLPLMTWLVATYYFGTLREAQIAAVIESSVPTMLMALGLADKYALDVESVALTIAWSTVLFLISLPFWLWVLIR